MTTPAATVSTMPWLLEGPPPVPVPGPREESPVKVRLHANELAEPWPREVLAAIAEVVRKQPLHRYSDPEGHSVRFAIGREYDVPVDHVVLGAGSLEVIYLLLRALAMAESIPARRVLVPEPSYPAYSQLARSLGLTVVDVPLGPGFELDEGAMRTALRCGVGICFFARPNNPTGTLWSAETVRALVHAYPRTTFVVDEVYLAYSGARSLWSPQAPSNLVCLSSLSKIGLAGLRLGYAIARPEIAGRLRDLQLPLSVPRLTMDIGELILTRFRKTRCDLIARVVTNRERLRHLLGRLPSAVVYPSAANLVLARLASPEAASGLVRVLARCGISIYGFPEDHCLSDCVRVSVGTASELAVLETALATWTAGAPA